MTRVIGVIVTIAELEKTCFLLDSLVYLPC
jgi:hypothetical protein